MTASPLPLSALVDKHRFELSPAERSAAAFFVEHGDRLGFWSAIEIARALGVSDATVVRTAQTLGYSGFNELKRSLRAGAGDATLAERMRATIPSGGGASDALVGVLREHRTALEALDRVAAEGELDAAVDLLTASNRIVLAATGPSAPLASYGEALLSRIGIPALVLSHNGESAADDMLRLSADDAVIVLAYGRLHRHVRVLLEECQTLGLAIVLCTDTLALPATLARGVVIRSGRGVPGRSASHSSTTLVLEALAIALAARRPDVASDTLDRLNALRRRITGRATPER